MRKLLIAGSAFLVPFALYSQSPKIVLNGKPDFSGNWENFHEISTHRATEYGPQRSYSEEQVQAILSGIAQKEAERAVPLSANRPPPPVADRPGSHDDFFDDFPSSLMRINGEFRTSIIIQPDDGTIHHNGIISDFYGRSLEAGFKMRDHPELAGTSLRCLHSGWLFPFMGTVGLGRNGKIIQTDQYLMILGEYPYYPRIIPFVAGDQGESYFKDKTPQWMGHSYAFWDENKLVVRTSRVRDELSRLPTHENRAFTNGLPISSETTFFKETFELQSSEEILYRWEATDEIFLEQSVVGEVLLTKMTERLYEFACHEGNYGLLNALRGARREDVEAEF